MKNFYIFLLITLLSTQLSAQSLSRIDLTGHPKAKGIAIAVKYPSDWDVKEAERPNIVKKFTKNYSDSIAMMMVQVINLPIEARAEMKSFNLKDWKEVLSETGTVISVSKTKLELEDAYVGDLYIKMERMGIAPYQRQKIVSVYYKDKWIWLWCGVVGNPQLSSSQVDARFQMIQTQCTQFFNSFVLLDRYLR